MSIHEEKSCHSTASHRENVSLHENSHVSLHSTHEDVVKDSSSGNGTVSSKQPYYEEEYSRRAYDEDYEYNGYYRDTERESESAYQRRMNKYRLDPSGRYHSNTDDRNEDKYDEADYRDHRRYRNDDYAAYEETKTSLKKGTPAGEKEDAEYYEDRRYDREYYSRRYGEREYDYEDNYYEEVNRRERRYDSRYYDRNGYNDKYYDEYYDDPRRQYESAEDNTRRSDTKETTVTYKQLKELQDKIDVLQQENETLKNDHSNGEPNGSSVGTRSTSEGLPLPPPIAIKATEELNQSQMQGDKSVNSGEETVGVEKENKTEKAENQTNSTNEISTLKKRVAVLEYEKVKLIQLLKDAQSKILSQKKELQMQKETTKSKQSNKTPMEEEKGSTNANLKVNTTSQGEGKEKQTVEEGTIKNATESINNAEKEAVVTTPAAPTTEAATAELTTIQTELKELKEKYANLSKQRLTDASEHEKKIKQVTEISTKEINRIKEQAKKLIRDLQKDKASTSQKQHDMIVEKLQSNTVKNVSKAAIVQVRQSIEKDLFLYQQWCKERMKEVIVECEKKRTQDKTIRMNYENSIKQRRMLYNQIQELKGNIRVLCRLRPLLPGEETCVIKKLTATEIQLSNPNINKEKGWEFDAVFSGPIKQTDIFNEVESLITSILDGYNVCIFAYGQTGSGKTYTMLGTSENPGINILSLRDLYNSMNQRSRQAEYIDKMTLSMLEIYNEEIYDLLGENKEKLVIRQNPNGKNHVPNLASFEIKEYKNIEFYMKLGEKKRSTYATDMNEHSSRSHTILSINLTSTHVVTNVTTQGKLHLIDLAGSERLSKTGATGQRLKEAQNINKSLSALGDVIAAKSQKQNHIPYRNSTLTHLLQDALHGDSKTLMVACASVHVSNTEETFCTLNFANRVKTVEMGKANKNIVAL